MDLLEQFLRDLVYKSLSSVLELADIPCGDKRRENVLRGDESVSDRGSKLSFHVARAVV